MNLPTAPAPGPGLLARVLMQVLWPAFLTAAVAVGVIFSLVDPHEISAVSRHLGDSREAAYTVGFLILWSLCALAGGMTWLLVHLHTNTTR